MQRLSTIVNKATSPELKAHVRKIKTLNAQFAQCVGEEVARHCRVANFSATRLLVHADSPLWRSKLRFLVPDIQRAVPHPDAPNRRFREISVRVGQPPPEKSPVPRPNDLSERTRRLLTSAAAGMDDPNLRRVLQRLAKVGTEDDLPGSK
ncbi:MAG: DUF721 domain-containing protein [Pseudomonadota bacterium]